MRNKKLNPKKFKMERDEFSKELEKACKITWENNAKEHILYKLSVLNNELMIDNQPFEDKHESIVDLTTSNISPITLNQSRLVLTKEEKIILLNSKLHNLSIIKKKEISMNLATNNEKALLDNEIENRENLLSIDKLVSDFRGVRNKSLNKEECDTTNSTILERFRNVEHILSDRNYISISDGNNVKSNYEDDFGKRRLVTISEINYAWSKAIKNRGEMDA